LGFEVNNNPAANPQWDQFKDKMYYAGSNFQEGATAVNEAVKESLGLTEDKTTFYEASKSNAPVLTTDSNGPTIIENVEHSLSDTANWISQKSTEIKDNVVSSARSLGQSLSGAAHDANENVMSGAEKTGEKIKEGGEMMKESAKQTKADINRELDRGFE